MRVCFSVPQIWAETSRALDAQGRRRLRTCSATASIEPLRLRALGCCSRPRPIPLGTLRTAHGQLGVVQTWTRVGIQFKQTTKGHLCHVRELGGILRKTKSKWAFFWRDGSKRIYNIHCILYVQILELLRCGQKAIELDGETFGFVQHPEKQALWFILTLQVLGVLPEADLIFTPDPLFYFSFILYVYIYF